MLIFKIIVIIIIHQVSPGCKSEAKVTCKTLVLRWRPVRQSPDTMQLHFHEYMKHANHFLFDVRL